MASLTSITGAAVLAAISAFSACDPAQARHPLSAPEQARPDPKLEGVWAARLDNGELLLTVRARPDGKTDAVLIARTDDGQAVLSYEVFPTALAGKTYLNVREKRYRSAINNEFTLEPTYQLIRYELKGDSLSVAYLDNDGAAKAVETGALQGDSAALAAWVAAAGPDAFKPLWSFKRQRLDLPRAPPKGDARRP